MLTFPLLTPPQKLVLQFLLVPENGTGLYPMHLKGHKLNTLSSDFVRLLVQQLEFLLVLFYLFNMQQEKTTSKDK